MVSADGSAVAVADAAAAAAAAAAVDDVVDGADDGESGVAVDVVNADDGQMTVRRSTDSVMSRVGKSRDDLLCLG